MAHPTLTESRQDLNNGKYKRIHRLVENPMNLGIIQCKHKVTIDSELKSLVCG